LTYYAVTRERGPAWDHTRPMRQQKYWDDHAAFMDALTDEGYVVLGGPLGAGERRFLLIFAADNEAQIRTRLAADPWTATNQLHLVSIEPWQILLGNPRRTANG
jgi:uncharacterized protein YciI